MTLPANIRVNVRVPFPALVQGAAFITIAKANGIWTIAPNYQLLAQAPSVTPTQIIAVYDTATGVWRYVTASELASTVPLPPTRIVTSSTTLTVLSTDQCIGLQRTAGVANMVANLLSGASVGFSVTLEDLVGNLQAYPVTVTPPAGQTIAGLSTYVMNQDRQSSTFRYYGSNLWSIS